MGFVLKYCVTCSKRVPEEDLTSGDAVEWRQRTYCKEHVPAEAREQQRPRRTAGGIAPSPAGSMTSTRLRRVSGRANPARASQSGRQAASASGRRAASRIGSGSGVRLPTQRRRSGRAGLVIAIVLLLGAGGGVAAVLMQGGRSTDGENRDAGNPVPPPVTPCDADPAPTPREAALARVEQALRDFALEWRAMQPRFSQSIPDTTLRTDAVALLGRGCTLRETLAGFESEHGAAPERVVSGLQSTLDALAEAATRDVLAGLVERANDLAVEENASAALRVLRSARAGAGELPAWVWQDERLWPGRQMAEQIARFQDQATDAVGLDAEGHAALAELEPLRLRVDAWVDGPGPGDPHTVRNGINLLRELKGLAVQRPAVDQRLSPAGLPQLVYREIVEDLVTPLDRHAHRELTAAHRTRNATDADRSTGEACTLLRALPGWHPSFEPLVDHVEHVMLNVDGAQHRDLLALELGRVNSTAKLIPALRGYATTMRRVSLIHQTGIPLTTETRERLIDVLDHVWTLAEAMAVDVNEGRLPQIQWLGNAALIYLVASGIPELESYRSRIQERTAELGFGGQATPALLAAMRQTIADIADGHDPGSTLGDALFPFRAQVVQRFTAFRPEENWHEMKPGTLAVLDDLVEDLSSRQVEGLHSAQQVLRYARQLDATLSRLSPPITDTTSPRLNQQISQLAGRRQGLEQVAANRPTVATTGS